jgi:hypothetical protein
MSVSIAVLGDMHVGSNVALSDDNHDDAFQPMRRALYDTFVHEATEGRWAKPDVLFLLADIIDGQNPKEGGTGLWTADLLEQIDTAVRLIKIWNPKKIFCLRGSDYHVMIGKTGFCAEEIIARQLGAEPYPNTSNEHSGNHWYVTIEDVTFHLQHYVNISKVWHYRTTPLAKELLYEKLNSQIKYELTKDMKQYKTNVILRAHAHYFCEVGFSTSQGFVNPCWKGIDSYMTKRGAISMSPDVGLIGFEVTGKNYTWEKSLYKFTEFQAPPHTILTEDEIKKSKE